jgi:hypothetical protein
MAAPRWRESALGRALDVRNRTASRPSRVERAQRAIALSMKRAESAQHVDFRPML